MKFIKRDFDKFNEFNSVRFCLSYVFIAFKVCLFQWKFALFHGRRHDVTCSHRKCYVTCGHDITYDIAFIYWITVSHLINLINTCTQKNKYFEHKILTISLNICPKRRFFSALTAYALVDKYKNLLINVR